MRLHNTTYNTEDTICSERNTSSESSNYKFTTFCNLINEYDIIDEYFYGNDDKALTIFVPTDEAFIQWEYNYYNNVVGAAIDEESEEEYYKFILLYHIIIADNVFTYNELQCKILLETLNGQNSRTKCLNNNEKYQSGSGQKDNLVPLIIKESSDINILSCDNYYNNNGNEDNNANDSRSRSRKAIIHIVDNVIMPRISSSSSINNNEDDEDKVESSTTGGDDDDEKKIEEEKDYD
jgi:uncharacterized surface protein with fasciclin (FAS1) repeats